VLAAVAETGGSAGFSGSEAAPGDVRFISTGDVIVCHRAALNLDR